MADIHFNSGDSNGMARLTDANAAEIKRRGISGEHPRLLADVFNVSIETTTRIISGKAWKHITVNASPPLLPEGKSEYRVVPGWDNYAVGKDGTLWNLRYGRWRIAKGTTQRQGYICIHLKCGQRKQRIMVHRLVLLAFVGPCPENMEACHYNGIKHDNRLSNLRWDTKVGNRVDGKRLGEIACGERSGQSVLTETSVRELLLKYPNRTIRRNDAVVEAKRLGVTFHTVLSIVYRTSWSWIR